MAKDVACRIIKHDGMDVLAVPVNDAINVCFVPSEKLELHAVLSTDVKEMYFFGTLKAEGSGGGDEEPPAED